MTETEATEMRAEYTAEKERGAGLCAVLPPAIFLLCLAVGTYFGGTGGAVVTLENPFSGASNFILVCATLCLWDILQVFALGITAGERLFVPVSAVVLAVRGMALGIAVSFCTTNALPSAAIGMTASYAAASILMTVYALLLHRLGKEAGLLYRLLCYFAVSGAVALLRLLPYLLL